MKKSQNKLTVIKSQPALNERAQINQYVTINDQSLKLQFGQACLYLSKDGSIKFHNGHAKLTINAAGQINIDSDNQVKIFAGERIDLN